MPQGEGVEELLDRHTETATLTPGTIWASSMTAGRRSERTHRSASSCARSATAGSVSDW